mmetsp:Transcript_39374/g.112383  ORF Transcript_39374/g.112383 Transcript_39374/m.112383 type:complete len:416 (-) Transcript_39374:1335-2582(-)
MPTGRSCNSCCASARCLCFWHSCESRTTSTWRCRSLDCIFVTSAITAAPCAPRLFASFSSDARKSCAPDTAEAASLSSAASSSQARLAPSSPRAASLASVSSPDAAASFSTAASAAPALSVDRRCWAARFRSTVLRTTSLSLEVPASSCSCRALISPRQGSAASRDSRRASTRILAVNGRTSAIAFWALDSVSSQLATAVCASSAGSSSPFMKGASASIAFWISSCACCTHCATWATSSEPRTLSSWAWRDPEAAPMLSCPCLSLASMRCSSSASAPRVDCSLRATALATCVSLPRAAAMSPSTRLTSSAGGPPASASCAAAAAASSAWPSASRTCSASPRSSCRACIRSPASLACFRNRVVSCCAVFNLCCRGATSGGVAEEPGSSLSLADTSSSCFLAVTTAVCALRSVRVAS